MNNAVFWKIGYGVYVLTSRSKGRINGQVANAIIQVCANPPMVAFAINKGNLTHEFLEDSKVAAISILSQDAPLKLIGQFGFKSGREVDKFLDVAYRLGANGCPILTTHSTGYLEVKVTGAIDAQTHTVFLGEVTDGDLLMDEEPMTYAYYHEVKRGATPARAPTHIEAPSKGVAAGTKYKCSVCNYIYDPEQGDKESGIPPGTSFENLPDNWTCPVCGATRDMFEPVR